MNPAFGLATDALVRARQTIAEYSADGQTWPVPAVFTWAYNEVRPQQGPAIGSRRPDLFVAFADLPVKPAQGHTVRVADQDWQVVSARPNAENTGAHLVLKAA